MWSFLSLARYLQAHSSVLVLLPDPVDDERNFQALLDGLPIARYCTARNLREQVLAANPTIVLLSSHDARFERRL